MPGPHFVKYFGPVIAALKALGNSGTPSEVCNLIAKDLVLSNAVLDDLLDSGASRFQNQVAWARFYLAKGGFIDSSKRGVWTLTEKGANANITNEEALRIFREIYSQFGNTEPNEETQEETAAPPEPGVATRSDYRAELLETIRQLPPGGFERLCKRLLRESGFQQVDVTGRSGDGGIDGRGILQINPLLSMQVIFQSKRYSANNSVTVSQIRDLRGAMAGRTDKGIFITTGTFTTDARREALREGVPPIELVDADKLVDMFEQLELGLIPRRTYEVDRSFFEEFCQDDHIL